MMPRRRAPTKLPAAESAETTNVAPSRSNTGEAVATPSAPRVAVCHLSLEVELEESAPPASESLGLETGPRQEDTGSPTAQMQLATQSDRTEQTGSPKHLSGLRTPHEALPPSRQAARLADVKSRAVGKKGQALRIEAQALCIEAVMIERSKRKKMIRTLEKARGLTAKEACLASKEVHRSPNIAGKVWSRQSPPSRGMEAIRSASPTPDERFFREGVRALAEGPEAFASLMDEPLKEDLPRSTTPARRPHTQGGASPYGQSWTARLSEKPILYAQNLREADVGRLTARDARENQKCCAIFRRMPSAK